MCVCVSEANGRRPMRDLCEARDQGFSLRVIKNSRGNRGNRSGMPVAGTRRLCRVGLAAVLVTALCILTLLDSPPARLPDPPTDPPPTPGGEPPGTRSIVAYSWARRLALDYRPTKQCDGNGTRVMALNAYELPGSSKWLETIPEQLFLYSAHLDLRIAGYPSIRVIGVKRGALPSPALFCTIWYREHGGIRSLSVEALITTIWLDEWGDAPDSYTGILVNCQLPLDGSVRHTSRVHVGPSACHENASHSLMARSEFGDGTSPDRKRRQFTLCIKGLDFDEDISRKLIAFVELHRILGAQLFHFYVFNVHENVLKVLRLYERSNVVRWFTLDLPGDLPNEKTARRRFFGEDIWTKRRMELIPYNHCFYENLHRSEYVVPIDIDEAIVPTRRKTWHELLLDERAKLGRSFKDFASYSARNAYFFPELQNKSQADRLTGIDEKFRRSAEYTDYLDTMRTASISPEGDSVKSFVSTKRALTVHNHYALTTLNPSTRRTHHLDSNDVLKHHHRACDSQHLDCDLLMENVRIDESALRYADELNTRMKITLADLDALS